MRQAKSVTELSYAIVTHQAQEIFPLNIMAATLCVLLTGCILAACGWESYYRAVARPSSFFSSSASLPSPSLSPSLHSSGDW